MSKIGAHPVANGRVCDLDGPSGNDERACPSACRHRHKDVFTHFKDMVPIAKTTDC
jgi:hypothetical protein